MLIKKLTYIDLRVAVISPRVVNTWNKRRLDVVTAPSVGVFEREPDQCLTVFSLAAIMPFFIYNCPCQNK